MASTPTATLKTAEDNAPSTTQAKDKLNDAVTQAQDSVKDAANTVRDTVTDVAERTVSHTQTVQGDFDKAVRRNPTLAVLGALGVGVALGLALNRRA